MTGTQEPIDEPTDAEKALYLQWVEERPESVREVCRRLVPWRIWKIKETSQLCMLRGVSEPGFGKGVTVRVLVLARPWNETVVSPYEVFGIPSDSLAESN